MDELTKRFMDLDLPEYDRMIIDDYIACLQTVDCRYADISYMAGVNTDDSEHSARSFRADLPPFQSNLSALLSTRIRKSSAYLSGYECNDRFSIPPESLFRAL